MVGVGVGGNSPKLAKNTTASSESSGLDKSEVFRSFSPFNGLLRIYTLTSLL